MFVNDIENQSDISGLKVSATPKVLANIRENWCKAAVWDRRPLATFQAWMDGLKFEQLPTARLILRPDTANDAVMSVCQGTNISDDPEAHVLADDVAALTHIFASVMETEFVSLRLQASNNGSQLKFDPQAVKVRLHCVYRGEGPLYECSTRRDGRAQTYKVPNGSALIARGHEWQSDACIASICPTPSDAHSDNVHFVLTLEAVSETHRIPTHYH